jgi:molybdenum cofactor biosynthesis enzyme MoaA
LQAKKGVLDKQRDEILAKIDQAERKAAGLNNIKLNTHLLGNKSDVDSLEAFMTNISSGIKGESKKKLELRLKEVESERDKILKLIAIAKPSLEKQKLPPSQPVAK